MQHDKDQQIDLWDSLTDSSNTQARQHPTLEDDAVRSALDNAPRGVLVKALIQKQQELNESEAQQQHLSHQLNKSTRIGTSRALFLMILIGVPLVCCYAIYAHYRAQTKLDNQYQRTLEQITKAYQGDPIAHAEVIRALPILAQRRLPRTLLEQPGESVLPVSEGQTQLRSDVPADHTSVQFEGLADQELALEFEPVPVYSAASKSAAILGRLINDSDITWTNQQANSEWTQIMLALGMPVWVHGDYVNRLENNLGRVQTQTGELLMRTHPSVSKSQVIGRIKSGDTVYINKADGDWLQINTPANYKFWITSTDAVRLTQ